ncbi:efflux RND transporter permease subunit [Halobacteriovorax sp. DPLXC-1]|uniref:efflux RND transporter permease subunit n=1 Tax=Halobacteriovorax sp. DPLXC-1 TaxID=3110771 RepID=UPI002FF1985E
MSLVSKFFIENHKFTIVVTFFLLIYGLMGLNKMTAESYPTVSFATAVVTTVYDGASANDIEIKITKPIEDEIRTVSGVKDVKSTSQAGLSKIVIRVDMDNVDSVDDVMSDLQKAVDRVSDLPTDLQDAPLFQEVNSEEIPVYQIALVGPNNIRERDALADVLKEDIEDIKAVKGVTLDGFSKRRFEIILDLKKLNQMHIGIDEVLNKLRLRNVNIPGGTLKSEDDQKLVRIEAKVQNVEQLRNILIRSNFSGSNIFLKDVAKVVDGKEERKVITSYNGEEATLITISKKAGEDTIQMVEKIKEHMKEFEKRYPEYKFYVYNNEEIKVVNKLEVLASNAISGLLLVVFFLFIFLPGRIGLLASFSLPLAVFGTLGFMPDYGLTLNAMTILALVIALGMLVDNSVVISENFTRLMTEEGYSAKDAALKSVKSLWLPITGTAMTTIAAFLPMLVTKGIMGQFIKAIPIIVTASLILSLIESFFLLPMRLAKYSGSAKKTGKEKKADWFAKFQSKFESLMAVAVRHRYISVFFFTSVIIGSLVFMAVGNKFILFPADQTEIYLVRYEAKRGTPVEQTEEYMLTISKKIKEKIGDQAKHIVGFAGKASVGFSDPKDKEGNNVGLIFVYVNDYAKFNIAETVMLKKLREIKMPELKSLTFESQVNGPPVGEDIQGTFRSNSFEQLDKIIGEISNELGQINGVLDLKTDDVFGDEEVYVDIDYVKADQLGVTASQIGNAVRSAVAGSIASTVTLDNKDVDLEVRFKKALRGKPSDILNIKVMDNRGNLIPLSSVAKVRKEEGTPNVKRYDFKRAKTLIGSVDNINTTSAAANSKLKEIFERVSSKYPGVSLRFGGAAESTAESLQSLAEAGVLAIIAIFAILVFLFKSFLRPMIIMMTIPLGFIGFSIAFATPILSGYPDRSRPISFLALIGIIGLAGIIVNSGIVLISFIDELRQEGKLSLDEILVKASGLRLRAVLVTSLTTVSGLLPTAYGIGGSDAMLVPMTMSMAWGLTSGTIMTLIFIPCAYAIIEDVTIFGERIKNKLFKKEEGEVESEEEITTDVTAEKVEV